MSPKDLDMTPILNDEVEIVLIHPLSKYAICLKDDHTDDELHKMIMKLSDWWDDPNSPFLVLQKDKVLIKIGEVEIIEVENEEI